MSWTRSLLLTALLAACSVPDLSTLPGLDVAQTESPATEDSGIPTQRGFVVRVRPVGANGVLPSELVVRASEPVFEVAQVGGALPSGTMLRVEPETPGAWTVTDLDTLTFRPDVPLTPDTEYRVRISALGTGEPRRPESPGAWDATFRTPAFGFQRMALRERDPRANRITVDLVFTGPVRVEDVSGRATFGLGDTVVRPSRRSAGRDANVVEFSFTGREFFQEVPLTVALGAGVPMYPAPGGGAVQTAVVGNGRVDLAAGQAMTIKGVQVKEGATGFYVDVVCDDDAGGDKRYYWDRDTWEDYRVSERCELSADDARRSIHFTPDVAYTLAPGPVGFRLFGAFEEGQYGLRMDAGLRTVDGGMLGATYDTTLTVPARSPSVKFAAKGRYLPRSAWDELAVAHVNIDAVELTIRHVPEENLVFWMSGDEPLGARTSNVVLKKRIPVRSQPDDEVTTYVDVDGLVPNAGRGLYELKVHGLVAKAEEPEREVVEVQDTGWSPPRADQSEEGPTDVSRLLLTDLQIIAKLASPAPGQDWSPTAHVWVVGTHDNKPVGGADVRVVRASGQSLGTCRTDPMGLCLVKLRQDATDDSGPLAIIARKDDDLTYLKFADLKVALADDTHGIAYLDEQPYRAAAYTERGVYRPGETAHVVGIVRDTAKGFVAPSAQLPVVAKLYDPRGKEVRKQVATTNTSGMVAVDWAFGDFATTGRYRTALEVADRNVGEVAFAVEEFVPERMKVDAAIEGAHRMDAPVPVAVAARWLFGGSASGSKVELSCQLVPGGFKPKQNKTFHYGLSDLETAFERRPVTLGTLSGKLDDDGRITLDCPSAGRSGGAFGAATLVAQAAVFEGDSGRTTVGEARAPIHPAPFYVGLSGSAGKIGVGDALQVSGVVVDWDGAIAPAAAPEVQVELMRLEEEYVYTWDAASGRHRYRRLLRPSQEQARSVPVSQGRFSITLTPGMDAAGYLVVATAGEARTELKVDGKGRRYWWYGDESSVDQTPKPHKPGELALEVPEALKVGEKVTVRTVAPYAGRMLFTAETHDLLTHKWVDVVAGPVEWTFTAHAFVPNVYVGALLIKDPHLESAEAFLPDRAFGVASVRVRPDAYADGLKIAVPREIRPFSTLDVEIDVGPQSQPTHVTVAAVDEGILSLTKFQSPDPFAQIFARRALGVTTYETVGWTLLVPPSGAGRTTGGDEGLAGAGRVQMVKPVALWSGIVEVPRSGKTTVSLDVPGYRGELRVMVVSAGPEKMGHADAQVTVKDPIVLQTTLPRFLVAGDEALLPVFVSNASGKAREIVVDLTIDDIELPGEKSTVALGGDRPSPVVVTSDRQQRLSLADGASDTVLFRVRADRAPDAARFRITAKSDGLQSFEELELPVARPEVDVRETTRVVLAQGATDLSGALQGWVPGSDRTRVWVTTNPYGPALSHIRAMVRYPYGCIEQTTSSTRPLLYVSTMLDAVDPELAAESPIEDMVRAGVQRILSMQTAAGGFAYWPGGSMPNYWGTAYATHLLLDAKDKGHAVPEPALRDALQWLGREVDKVAGTSSDDFTTAYAHYVLARGGQARTAQAETLLKNMASGTSRYSYRDLAEPRYLLQAAMYLGGDRRYEAELRKPDTSDLTNKRRNDWTFWSDLRSRAFVLSIYHDLFGARGAEGEALATLVGNGLASQRSTYYTTQEMGWGLTALGKWVGEGLSDLPKPTLVVDGRRLEPNAVKSGGGADYVWTVAGLTGAGAVSIDLPRTGGKAVYAVVSTQGVRAQGTPALSEGLSITRTLVGGDGRSLGADHKLGDPVFVRVSIRNDTGSTQQNVALVDRIPAGWEIENPRLGRGTRPDWLDDGKLWSVDHMNLRDDRVEVFGTLSRGETREVVYQVRAVTGGTFTHPATTAEVMYDPQIRARTSPSRIKVATPWDGS